MGIVTKIKDFTLSNPAGFKKLSLDGQLNSGSVFAVDFSNKYCFPGVVGNLSGGERIKSLVSGGLDSEVLVGAGGAASFNIENKGLDLSSNGANGAFLDTKSVFGLRGSTQYNFGFSMWITVARDPWFIDGWGTSVAAMDAAISFNPNKTPLGLILKKKSYYVQGSGVNANGTLTFNGHGFTNGLTIDLNVNSSHYQGLSNSIRYYVVNATANTFGLSATPGGAQIQITIGGNSVIETFYEPFKLISLSDRGYGDLEGVPNSDQRGSINRGVPAQLFMGWEVRDGASRTVMALNGGEANGGCSYATPWGSDVLLPETGFSNLKFGVGSYTGGSQTKGAMRLHRAVLENLSISGRTMQQMYEAEYVKNKTRFI